MPHILNTEILESQSNKVTVIDENVTNEQYPSAKAVYDAMDNIAVNVDSNLPISSVPEEDTSIVLPENSSLFSGNEEDTATDFTSDTFLDSIVIGDTNERIYTLDYAIEKTLTIQTGDRKYFKLDGYYLVNLSDITDATTGDVLYTLTRKEDNTSEYNITDKSNKVMGTLHADTGLLAFNNAIGDKSISISYVIMRAEGNVVIGRRSLAAGKQNTVKGGQSFSFGSENTLYGIQTQVNGLRNFNKVGDHNFIVGFDNLNDSGANNTISGALNYNKGSNNFVAGSRNVNLGSNGVMAGTGNYIASGTSNNALGQGLTVYGTGNTVVGKFNKFSSSDIFQVGNGTGLTNRKTAFGVRNDNSAYVATQGTTIDSITRKDYVDAIKSGLVKEVDGIKSTLTQCASVILNRRTNAMNIDTLTTVYNELSSINSGTLFLEATFSELLNPNGIDNIRYWFIHDDTPGDENVYSIEEYNGKYGIKLPISEIPGLKQIAVDGDPAQTEYADRILWSVEYPIDTKTYIHNVCNIEEEDNEELTTWDQVQALIRNMGNAAPPFFCGDIIEFEYDGGTMEAMVIGMDEEDPVDSNYQHSMSFIFMNEALPTNYGWFLEKQPTTTKISYLDCPLRKALETDVISKMEPDLQKVLGKVVKYAKSVDENGNVEAPTEDRENWRFETYIFPPTTMDLYTNARTVFTADDNFFGDVNKSQFEFDGYYTDADRSADASYDHFYACSNGKLYSEGASSTRIMELKNGTHPSKIVTRNIVKTDASKYFYWDGTNGVIGNSCSNNTGYVFPIFVIY